MPQVISRLARTKIPRTPKYFHEAGPAYQQELMIGQNVRVPFRGIGNVIFQIATYNSASDTFTFKLSGR